METNAPGTTAICPHCSAPLQRPEPSADGRVLCLNCGKRFALDAARSEGGVAAAMPAHSGEPPVPAYLYLRATGCLAAALGIGWTGSYFMRPTFPLSWDVQHFLSAITPAIVGLFLWAVTGSLVRVDAAVTGLAWQRGLLREPLTAPAGSSLPYVLPPAAAGSLAGIFLTFKNLTLEDGGSIERALLGGVIVGASLIGAFAFDNLRHFLLRQTQLAQLLSRRKSASPAPRVFGAVARWLALAWVGLVALTIATAFTAPWSSIKETELQYLGAAAVLVSILLLVRDFSDSVRAWQGWVDAPSGPKDLLLRSCRWLAYLLSLTMILFAATLSSTMVRKGHLELLHIFVVCFVVCALMGMEMAIAGFVWQLADGRQALERRCGFSGSYRGAAGWAKDFAHLLVAFTTLTAVFLGLYRGARIYRELFYLRKSSLSWLSLPQMEFGELLWEVFLPLALFLILREILRIEAAATRAHETALAKPAAENPPATQSA